MGNFISGVISLTLGVIMVSSVLIPQVKGTNTDSWTTAEVTLWGVVTLGGIIGIVYGSFAIFGLA